MKDALITLLETFKYPVRLQGSLSKDELYPESFFTFWNDETSDQTHYDNDAPFFVWSFTIYFYSTSPALVNTILLQVRTLLKQNGWIVPGVGYDVPSDEQTHTGRAIEVMYIQGNVPVVPSNEVVSEETTGIPTEENSNLGG